MSSDQDRVTSSPTRRQFIKKSSLLAAATGAASHTILHAAPVHAGGSDVLKIGLIGCGGRGTGAVVNALQADENIELTAMADAFGDRIQSSLETLQEEEATQGKVNPDKVRRFTGFDAADQLIASDVDVVLLATPPHFRPMHLKAAIDAGKHVFCEKPVAVDAPGVRSVLETCLEAGRKGLSVVSGLCLRYHQPHIEGIQKIHDGEIGDVHTLYANDYRGEIWVKDRKPDWTDMHLQMRNWYYYTWLSGDFNVEQHVHYLDLCTWVKDSYPIKAIGTGGRQARTQEKYGNIYDHHSVVYEYEDGARLVANCRQQDGCVSDVRAIIQGTKGSAQFASSKASVQIGDEKWKYRGKTKNMYDVEHDRLYESIRKASPINNGDYMAKSTLLAIMGRMATYTGQVISWDQAMNSQEDLTPEKYEWGPAPEVVIARPGVTKFV